MSQCLVTQKVPMIIDIGIFRSRDISHRDIETQREFSFRGIIPMEVSTLGYGEIRHIIAIVATTVQKHQQISTNNNMGTSYFTMHAAIPPGVRYADVDP